MERNKCKNCESPLYGKFCSSCGQKEYTEKDKSISNIFHEGFHFITHFEGKLFNTLKTIYQYPGKLSLDYGNGIRQKYYKPVSFYLLIVVLYLLFPMAKGMNMEMNSYEGNSTFSAYMSHQIEDKLLKDNISREQLAEKFDEKSKKASKFLLLLLIPLAIPLLYLLYLNNRRNLFDNLILLTEINIFFLLSFFILSPIILLPFVYFLGLDERIVDSFYGPFLFISFGFYCIFLFHKVYQEKWWISTLKGGVFGLTFLFMVFSVYRLIVFATTFALI